MVEICSILRNSRAEKAGIRAGDVLLTVNGNEITDVLDYRFYLTDTHVTLELSRDGKRYSISIKKAEYDDIGLEFETPLMDKKHSCRNKCIFCFIDQLPEGMRDTLYFKDDDSRLSFLHGNYITLTNLTDADVDRIIKMHISPINVSVHTTNPELRVSMMKNKNAGKVLSYLDRFKDAGIKICAQIVLCKGINDKAELDRSMKELEELFPALTSCSVVPAGLTKYRDKLYPLELFNRDECKQVIEQVTAYGDECIKKHGTRLFFCADEFYVQGGLPIPKDEFYEDYFQLENGVGMLRLLDHEFNFELDYLLDGRRSVELSEPITVSIATGAASYDTMRALVDTIENKTKGLKVHLYKIENSFFGSSVTVSGLLTGVDIAEQLKNKPLGDRLLLPACTLRAEGDLFLCGMTPDELSEKLGGIKIEFVKNDGAELLSAILGSPLC